MGRPPSPARRTGAMIVQGTESPVAAERQTDTGGVCFESTRTDKLFGVLLMQRHPLAGHAFVELELGNVIALDGHDPSGSRVIIGVKGLEPSWWPLFVRLWEGANKIHTGSDSLVYHSRIRSLRMRG
jgi:hypothetical protein